MLIAFFDKEGIVHHELVLEGHICILFTTLRLVSLLWDTGEESNVEKWCNCWILHHDNTPQYSVMAVQQFLVEKQIILMLQPPYLSDLAPCDF
jgi:hypothetical protein